VSSLRAAVIVPTHDHAATLPFAIASARGQTVVDVEIHVIGDGVADDTRAVMAALVRADPRVRFHDRPKGARHGELHRHEILAGLDAAIVVYLADDDLLAPDHVAAMEVLLAEADFAHPATILVQPDGHLRALPVDLSMAPYRTMLRQGQNRVPLTGVAHTMAAYRRLPFGWRTTPEGTPTDLHMWRQFLAQPWCRAVSGSRMSALVFPSPPRVEWSPADRVGELTRWSTLLADPTQRAALDAAVTGAWRQEAITRELRYERIAVTGWWRSAKVAGRRVRRWARSVRPGRPQPGVR
jgi:glycosyltransferase involved in cell wall biosynthesis